MPPPSSGLKSEPRKKIETIFWASYRFMKMEAVHSSHSRRQNFTHTLLLRTPNQISFPGRTKIQTQANIVFCSTSDKDNWRSPRNGREELFLGQIKYGIILRRRMWGTRRNILSSKNFKRGMHFKKSNFVSSKISWSCSIIFLSCRPHSRTLIFMVQNAIIFTLIYISFLEWKSQVENHSDVQVSCVGRYVHSPAQKSRISWSERNTSSEGETRNAHTNFMGKPLGNWPPRKNEEMKYSASHSRVAQDNVSLQKEQKCYTFASYL
jgi:hypothetical protein